MPWRERGSGEARMGGMMLSFGPSIFPSLLGCGTQFETYRLWHSVPKKLSLIYIPFLNYDNALLEKGSNYCWLIQGRFWRRDSNWNKFVTLVLITYNVFLMDAFVVIIQTIFQMISLLVHLCQRCFKIVMQFHIDNF